MSTLVDHARSPVRHRAHGHAAPPASAPAVTEDAVALLLGLCESPQANTAPKSPQSPPAHSLSPAAKPTGSPLKLPAAAAKNESSAPQQVARKRSRSPVVKSAQKPKKVKPSSKSTAVAPLSSHASSSVSASPLFTSPATQALSSARKMTSSPSATSLDTTGSAESRSFSPSSHHASPSHAADHHTTTSPSRPALKTEKSGSSTSPVSAQSTTTVVNTEPSAHSSTLSASTTASFMEGLAADGSFPSAPAANSSRPPLSVAVNLPTSAAMLSPSLLQQQQQLQQLQLQQQAERSLYAASAAAAAANAVNNQRLQAAAANMLHAQMVMHELQVKANEERVRRESAAAAVAAYITAAANSQAVHSAQVQAAQAQAAAVQQAQLLAATRPIAPANPMLQYLASSLKPTPPLPASLGLAPSLPPALSPALNPLQLAAVMRENSIQQHLRNSMMPAAVPNRFGPMPAPFVPNPLQAAGLFIN